MACNCGNSTPVYKRPWKVGLYYSRYRAASPTGTITYSKAPHRPCILFTWLTTNQYGIWNQHSLWCCKFFSEVAFVSTFDVLLHTWYSQRVLWAHCVYTMNLFTCSLCIVHLCTFTSIYCNDKVQLKIRLTPWICLGVDTRASSKGRSVAQPCPSKTKPEGSGPPYWSTWTGSS